MRSVLLSLLLLLGLSVIGFGQTPATSPPVNMPNTVSPGQVPASSDEANPDINNPANATNPNTLNPSTDMQCPYGMVCSNTPNIPANPNNNGVLQEDKSISPVTPNEPIADPNGDMENSYESKNILNDTSMTNSPY